MSLIEQRGPYSTPRKHGRSPPGPMWKGFQGSLGLREARELMLTREKELQNTTAAFNQIMNFPCPLLDFLAGGWWR